MKRIAVGLLLLALATALTTPAVARSQGASVAIAVSVRPTLAVDITDGPQPFQVRETDRGRDIVLPLTGQVRSNMKWVIALELPDSVPGPQGYAIAGSAISLRPRSGAEGLDLRTTNLALLTGRPTSGVLFGNQLTVHVPPGAPPGTYEVPVYLSITPGELGGQGR